MNGDTLSKDLAGIRQLMSERLRISGRSLEAQVRKAGRSLPKARARDARYLIHAEMLIQNPKLARMVDHAKVKQSLSDLTAYLKGIDPNERRKDRILWFFGKLAFYILVIGGVVITYLWWQGRV